jgi:hypothetical protein
VIGVRPSVTAQLQPVPAATVLRRGTRVYVQGTVKPSKRYALMLVDQLGAAGTKRRVGRRLVRMRAGRGRSSFRFTTPGRYVIRLALVPDAKNLGGRSKAIQLKVR